MRKFTSTILLLGLLFPSPTWAAGRVSIDDTIAGLEALVDLAGFPSNAALTLQIVSPSGSESTVPVRTDAGGTAALALPITLTREAGRYMALVRGAAGSAKTEFTVLPGRVDDTRSFLQTSTSRMIANGKDELTVTATLVDAFDNPLTGRPVEIISNRADDRIAPLTRNTDKRGEQHFVLTTQKAGDITLRAMDFLSGLMLQESVIIRAESAGGMGGATQSRSALTAQLTNDDAVPTRTSGFGDLDRFEVRLEPSNPKVNEVLNLTIRAVDFDGSTVEDYAGTVEVHAPNDPGASLPGFGNGHGTVQFSPKNLGKKTIALSVSFSRAGEQTIQVMDITDPQNPIRGETVVTVAGQSAQVQGKKIEILSHRDGGQVSGAEILLEGIGPAYANLEITGGQEDAFGETDAKGHFSIPVRLDPSSNDYTLRVRDDNRTYDSGPLHLVRDNEPPSLRFSFDPSQPAQDSDVLVTAESEAGLRTVTMSMQNQTLALSERADQPGVYDVLFRAPASGEYDIRVTAEDAAGNKTEATQRIHVLPRALPRVPNIRVEPGFNSVDVLWDAPAGEEISSYVVFVGTGSDTFGSSLDTGSPRTSVSVMGLKPGVRYSFAVAMVQKGRFGPIGDVLTATPLGLGLDVTPQDGALMLDWNYPDERVSSFVLEYGISPTQRTEKRIFTGEMRNVMLRDLLNGITYYLRLTPVTITGESLTQMAAEATGTPIGTGGFRPSGEDPIPFTPSTQPRLHDGAPSTADSGIPLFAMIGVTGISAAGFVLIRRRKTSLRVTDEFLRTMHNRYRQ